jgi:hypothetical protein
MIALALTSLIVAACNGAACPSPCTECAFQPVQGDNSDVAAMQQLFRDIAERSDAANLPDVDDVESGPARTRTPAPFPCRLLPAIGATESGISQFCSESGLTVISFDCGFGIMQVTSGASGYPGVQSREDINIAAGADILVQKWNGNESFGGSFGDSDPGIVEGWYFATWAYNGFVYGNNPNNPDRPANRPPFNGPGALSRGSYPYQELVWGYLRNPLVKGGEEMWQSFEVTYPDPASIPNQSGLFSVNVPLPEPSHTDACADDCTDCPPAELRTLFLDDADASFTVTGQTQEHASGGFRDRFLSAVVAPAGAGTVLARFEGTAPSTGGFDVAAFIPLDPATCEDVHITVRAVGLATELTHNQNVNGGFFQSIGDAVLGEGQPVVVEVSNASNDGDVSHRVGLDAFRFTWREHADLPPGEGEGEGDGPPPGDEGEGEPNEGEPEPGEGEAEGGANLYAISGDGDGDGCGATHRTEPDVVVILGALLVARRALRRRLDAGSRLWDDGDIPALARMADVVHVHGALAAIQLTHNWPTAANRYSREVPMEPRHEPVGSFDPVQARAMDKEDIRAVRRWHKQAAIRAMHAGFDIVTCYAAHGLAWTIVHGGSREHVAGGARTARCDAKKSARG